MKSFRVDIPASLCITIKCEDDQKAIREKIMEIAHAGCDGADVVVGAGDAPWVVPGLEARVYPDQPENDKHWWDKVEINDEQDVPEEKDDHTAMSPHPGLAGGSPGAQGAE